MPVTTQPATADEPATRQTEHDTAVLQAAKYLTGRFTSAEQAAQDADYFEIELHVARIWAERDDAIWLYVEQAAASALDRPYRQRVYEVVPLVDDDDARPADVVSKVHTLPGDPLDFAGGAADTALLDTISPADLTLRDGCAVYLRQTENGDFVGSTRGQGCVSSLAGAAYAISTVSLTATELRSWDRGFDENGDQVWGAEKGPYVFVRVAD
ncbi:MAG: chromophore lyase CpcT/CpeT [Planctomycetota bacterium]